MNDTAQIQQESQSHRHSASETSTLTMLEAIRQGLDEALTQDPDVILLGEDIGAYGGAFKTTAGLQDKHGNDRVIDTPLAEAAVVGAAAGAAMMGMKAVAELQFIDFISCAGFDQLVTVAAKSRYRNGVGCPIVLRGPTGGGGRGGPYHSVCPEMWAVSTPGIKVVFPSNPHDAKGLLRAAIDDPDPVLFLEHKILYRQIKDEVPNEDYRIPLGQAKVLTEGTDLSLVSYGATVHACQKAAEHLAEQKISCEVIDLRTLVPLDIQTVVSSIQKTNRVIVVHEDTARGGFAGEIMALINQHCFDYLDAPPVRIAAPNTPVPYAPTLEDAYLPNHNDIIQSATTLMRY